MEYNEKSNTFILESQNLRRKRKWDKNINEEINLRAFLICLIHQSANKINTKNVLFVFIRSNFLKIKNK